ncbi:cysteine proteinase [Marasmius fiardii PR-910]|nr:cysteine proteinase [Marasmius fiardii PR-910]
MARKWFSTGPQQIQSPRDNTPAVTIPLITGADAKKFGLENFGNTCYANSVIQALYFCSPFRDLLIQYPDPSVPQLSVEKLTNGNLVPLPLPTSAPRKPERKPSISGTSGSIGPTNTNSKNAVFSIPPSPPSLFSALRSLFVYISTNPCDKGTIAPRAFIDKVKDLNELFRSTMHQDAHEFFNYLLNRLVEEMQADKRQNSSSSVEDLSNSIATLASKIAPTTSSANSGTPPESATLIHTLFEGTLTSETRCLTCETVSSRDESFLDLSIDIEQNASVTACLRQFSASEMLCHKNKFFCDSCCDLQEAERRMKIKKLPNVLALHLKRFKYQEDVKKYIKLAYRVAFPLQLRLFNTVDDAEDADRLYNLFAIVVHIGSGPHHGHYISIIKTLGSWLVFDDDNVHPISESDIPKYYGENNAGSAYVLYYEAADIDPPALGIRTPPVALSTGTVFPTSEVIPTLPSPQPAPVLPPGLTEEGDSSDLSDPPFPITPSQSNSPLLPPDHEQSLLIPPKVDEPVTHLTSDATAPPNGRGMSIFPMRRPSSTHPRTAGVESERSDADLLSELVPTLHSGDGQDVSSAASTSCGHEHESSSSMLHSLPVEDKEKQNKDKEKEKSPHRKASGWFKRRSARLERPSTSHEHHLKASTNNHVDEPLSTQTSSTSSNGSSSTWYKPNHTNKDKKTRKMLDSKALESTGLFISGSRPKSSGGGLTVRPPRDRRSFHEHFDTPPSATSSTGSTQLMSSGSSPAHNNHHHQVLDLPPPRKSSLANVPPIVTASPLPSSPPSPLTPTSKSPRSPERKLSFSHLSNKRPSRKQTSDHHRPSTAPGTSTEGSLLESRSLPPVPPLPPDLTPPSPLLNGDAHPQFSSKEDSTPRLPNALPRPMTSDSPVVSPGLHSFAGQNSSSGSTESSGAAANFKRATRKLSISSPILGNFGFGKKDKEKKEREKERSQGPSSFTFQIA